MAALGHDPALFLLLVHGIVELGRERTFADASSVRLDYADHAIDVARGEAGADAGSAGGGIGGRHERIRTEVDVEHRALGAFEKDGLAGLLRLVEHWHRIADVGRELLLHFPVDGDEFFGIELVILDGAAGDIDRIALVHALVLEHAELGVRIVHLLADEIEEAVGEHVAAAQTRAGDLRRIGGADSAAGGADLLAGRAGGLFGLVERAVVEHDHLGAGGNEETALRFDTGRPEGFDLLDEIDRVHHDAVADHANLAVVENAAGNEAKHALLAFRDDGMAGIRSALVAYDEIRLVGKNVDNLALAFISPLGTDQNRIHS